MRLCTEFDPQVIRLYPVDDLNDRRIELLKLYKKERDSIEKSLATSRDYCATVENLVMDSLKSGTYTLMPYNMFLWLYCIGCSPVEKRRFFAALAERCRETETLKFSKMPVSRRVKDLVRSGKGFAVAGEQTYSHLQALICMLACAVKGSEHPGEEFRGAIRQAAPVFTAPLTHCKGLSAARYSKEMMSGWNIAVLKCEELKVAGMTLIWLMRRAQKALYDKYGKTVGGIPRSLWLARLIATLLITREEQERNALGNAFVGGRVKVWEEDGMYVV